MRGNSKALSDLSSNVIDRTFEQRLTRRQAEHEQASQTQRVAIEREDMLIDLFRTLPTSAQQYIVAVVRHEHDRTRE
jgi:hypothetical protein